MTLKPLFSLFVCCFGQDTHIVESVSVNDPVVSDSDNYETEYGQMKITKNRVKGKRPHHIHCLLSSNFNSNSSNA